MNILDRAISFVSPQAGIRRMAARYALENISFGRPGTEHRRGGSGGLFQNASSESAPNRRQRTKDMWDARDLAGRTWIGGTLGRIVLYTCGKIVAHANTGDDAVNAVYDDYFHAWCGDEEDDDGLTPCDLTGRFRFRRQVQMAMLGMLVDGDHGLVLADNGRTESGMPIIADEGGDQDAYPLKVQNIEADRIGNPLDAAFSETYINGVTILPGTGRVQGYRIFERTTLGQYINPRDIAPTSFLHLWDPQRADQYRGVTHLRPVLDDVRDLDETFESEKFACKSQSMYSAFVSGKNPVGDMAMKWDGRTAAGTPSQAAEFGKMLRLAEGESIAFTNGPQRPSGAFLNFAETIVRRIAVALDLPFGFVWDMAMLGGVTARIETQFVHRRVSYWQELLVDLILRRVRNAVLADAIARGILPPHRNFKKVKWDFGPWIVTDAGHEVTNDIALVRHGFMEAEAAAAKHGANLQDLTLSNAAAIQGIRQIGADTGTPMELLAPDWFPNATQMLSTMDQAIDPNPPPPPGSLEAVGEKGAAQIVDLLSKVTTGQIDRDSAKQTLVTVYGLSPTRAEAITPPKPKQPARGTPASPGKPNRPARSAR